MKFQSSSIIPQIQVCVSVCNKATTYKQSNNSNQKEKRNSTALLGNTWV